MHNSQAGAPLAFQLNTGHTGYTSVESPNPQLLLTNCVGCHTALDGYTWKDSSTGAPIVYNTGEPGEYLAGGNFYWVADEGDNDDAKGHNVLGISGTDSLALAPGGFDCGNDNCHKSLAVALSGQNASLKSGCEGCHLDVKHHADDGTGTKYVGTAPDKWYRFLTLGHFGSAPSGDTGVVGIEDADWQHTNSANDHNEYKGISGEGAGNAAGGTMTHFCQGCHENFHSDQTAENPSASPWFRHPSDFVIPNTGEYTNAFSSGYNPNIPVARPWNFDGFTTVAPGYPSGTVTPGTDMVMCLTCHRAHASPYYKMLRWHYTSTDLSYALYGCSKCHTSKN